MEVQNRGSATRGRSRGRGAYSSRSTSKPLPKDPNPQPFANPLEENSELSQLKKKYNTQLDTLRELFPEWKIEELVYALEDTQGDLETTVERITDGSVSRFNEIKKKPRDKSRSKPPAGEALATDAETTKTASTRGGRGRGGSESVRGRGRGSDRGRGSARGGRGGAGAALNGTRSTSTTATAPTDTNGWGSSTADAGTAVGWDQPSTDTWAGGEQATTASWDDTSKPVETKAISAAESQKSSLIPQGTTKSWASMLAKPKPAQTTPKQEEAVPAAAGIQSVDPSMDNLSAPPDSAATDWGAPSISEPVLPTNETPSLVTDSVSGDSQRITSSSLPPPKDSLTEDNLEHVPDASGHPTTETVASTRDVRSTLGSAHPSFHAGQPTAVRPSLGTGFTTSAQKAAGASGRSLSFQRLKEQQDAVVMPGNHAIDRSAVQFGSMNLDGEPRPLDGDEDREDAETRAQPPQQSPSQPRASLPPAPRAAQAPAEHLGAETLATTRHAPGLPTPTQQQSVPAAQAQHAPGAGSLPTGSEAHHYSQLGGRYGGSAFGQEPGAQSQKSYDPFNSQLYAQSQNDPQSMYGGSSQPAGSLNQPPTSQAGSYGQGQSDYANHYPAENARGNYSNYYGAYNQPPTSHQENIAPQRSTATYGAGESGYGAGHHSQAQSRFGENSASGHNTPNPAMGSQQQQQHHAGSYANQNQHMHQQSHGHGGYGGHPYGSPYGHTGYYQQYASQGYPNYYGYNQQGYGGHYGGKGAGYGGSGHHGYGMASHGSYDNASSPATTGPFGGSSSLQGRDSTVTSGLQDYPRSGSTQPASQAQHSSGTSAFGSGVTDAYNGRSSSGFGGHNQGFGSTPSTGANDDSVKSIHDSKTGPSPLGHAGRPASGFNSNNTSNQNYGATTNQQQGGFGGSGYPGHLGALHNQYGGSGYGGIGGLGQQTGSHGNQSGYAYGTGFGNNNYGGARGGWGGHYGGQYGQQH